MYLTYYLFYYAFQEIDKPFCKATKNLLFYKWSCIYFIKQFLNKNDFTKVVAVP